MTGAPGADTGPGAPADIGVVRIIARLNIGGPAIQAITMTRTLASRGYRTVLVRGQEGPREGNMDALAAALGVRPVRLRWMRRDPGPADAVALWSLVGLLRRERPDVVHTHAAKAGTLGRLATLALRRRRPVTVHTYHGHSLRGYFSSPLTRFYRLVERALARHTSCLVAISEEVRDELVELGVAPAGRFRVVPLGFDLNPFALTGEERAARRTAGRRALGLPDDAVVVTLVARLVPIKRVDRFLRVCASAARSVEEIGSGAAGKPAPELAFLVVGDGELRESLAASPEALALGDRLVWAGFRRDMPEVCFASDVVVLTSDNEGTPVSLIEAQAAGAPVVSTDVGGTRAVVEHEVSGLLAGRTDEPALSRAIVRLAGDPELRERMGHAGRERALRRFSVERLTDDLDRLYRELLRR